MTRGVSLLLAMSFHVPTILEFENEYLHLFFGVLTLPCPLEV